MDEIDIDEFLEDLQKELDNGNEEKIYWQEDMQFLIDELKKTRLKFHSKQNSVNALQAALKERTEERDRKDDIISEKQREIDDLNKFYETYDFRFNDAQCVLIGKEQFLKCIGVSGDMDIFIVDRLEEEIY